jgi:hypothetical protein
MEQFLNNQQIPLVQVIDPNTGQQYYAPAATVYNDRNGPNPTLLDGVTVDQATSASYTLTASYAANHAVITSSYICEGILVSNQTFATGSDVKILFVRYDDPNGWITSNQFQPTIAGYYSISFGVWLQNAGVSSNQVNTQMRKNGNSMILSQQPLNNGTGISLGGSRIIRMNGTTDYIDWTIFQGAGSSANGTILQGTANGSGTWFSAFLITQ